MNIAEKIAGGAKDKNLALMSKVFKTDVSFTKPAKKGAYQFTSIAPMYQKARATEALGPQGIGWGVKVGSETFDYKEIGETILLIYRAVMFFKWDGEVGEIPIAATEKLAYKTQGANGYLKVDDEADKKVKTAALTKGLSEIGVSADIHMNLHTNYEFQEFSNAVERMASGDDAQIRAANDEFKEWFNERVNTINLCTNEHAIVTVTNRTEQIMTDKLTVLKATQERRTKMQQKLYAAADAAKANLTK